MSTFDSREIIDRFIATNGEEGTNSLTGPAIRITEYLGQGRTCYGVEWAADALSGNLGQYQRQPLAHVIWEHPGLAKALASLREPPKPPAATSAQAAPKRRGLWRRTA